MYAFLACLGLLPECEQNVRAQLGALDRGCSTDLVTSLIPREYHDRKDYGRAVEAKLLFEHCEMAALPRHLLDREVQEMSRLGPWSVRRPYRSAGADGLSLQDMVAKFFAPRVLDIHEATLKSVVADVCATLGPKARLEPMGLEDAVNDFGNTSFGYPVFSSQKKYFNYIKDESEYLLRTLDEDDALQHLALLGTRTQCKGPGLPAKARVVFQCSRAMGNLETMIQAPLIAAIRHHPEFAAWNKRSVVDDHVTRFMEQGKWFLSMDYSNFDGSVCHELIGRVFDCFCEWFSTGTRPLIRFLQRYFQSVGLIAPDGCFYDRTGGIPSGSKLTNLVGTYVNIIATRYAAARTGQTIQRGLYQGDDGSISFSKEPDVASLASVLKAELGMKISPEKSFLSTTGVRFLQFNYDRCYTAGTLIPGVRSIIQTFGKMSSLERYRVGLGEELDGRRKRHAPWSGEMHTIRWIQQMGNCDWHPCFESLVTWFLQKDKMAHLPFSVLVEGAGGRQKVEYALAGGQKGLNVLEALESSSVVRLLRLLS